MIRVRFKILHPEAILPQYAHGADEDAGMDLRAVGYYQPIQPGEIVKVDTGVAVELPTGYVGKICPRSGLALKHGVTVLNAPGVLDPSFRGSIAVILINLGKKAYTLEKSERVGQLVVHAYEKVVWEESELSESLRGSGGFGSSGRN